MTDGDRLLAAILANPAEDAPRLMYADWLEENGQPERAAFIRVQVELNGVESDPANLVVASEYKRQRRRERELLNAHGYGWLDGLLGPEWKTDGRSKQQGAMVAKFTRGTASTEHIRFRYVRGLVDEITCTAADWITHGDAIHKAHPVRDVVLTTEPVPRLEEGAAVTEDDWVRARLDGRIRAHSVPYRVATGTAREWAEHLLKCEWAGVEFSLPPPNTLTGTGATLRIGRADIIEDGTHRLTAGRWSMRPAD